MRSPHPFLATFCLLLVGTALKAQSARVDACPVTMPAKPSRAEGGNYGNEFLSTGLWPDGAVIFKPGGPGFIVRDSALSMKFWWWRLVPGRLTLEGRRLDGPSPPFRAQIPTGYGDVGFQATALVFPTPGCWEVTGRIGDATLTFVTRVVKIAEGPSSRGDW